MANISSAMLSGRTSGDGPFTKLCQTKLESIINSDSTVLLTTSCTHALEMSAILLNLEPGDEVIIPSYTFVTSALAFVMHGATPVFADIRSDTMNIDEAQIDKLITSRTRAIVVVHYAGVACDMDKIMALANQNDLVVIEDNAHGLFGKYKGRVLGSIGHMATQSFHETKNITCGEGGALVLNHSDYIERAEIIREKGTDRAKFFRGQVDKYRWVDKGSSYVMSDILAAILSDQLDKAQLIQNKREKLWCKYREDLEAWADKNNISIPFVPEYCEQAYHMFYLIFPSLENRTRFIEFLKQYNISAVFHYVPLHTSHMGVTVARSTDCPNSSEYSERLLRLPFYTDMSEDEYQYIIKAILSFEK